MRKRVVRIGIALLIGMGVPLVVSLDGFAGVSLTLQATPAPVARGEVLTYTGGVTNGGLDPLDSATIYVPLPTGIDQWTASYRLDSGDWTAYPANGLIPLDSIPAGEGLEFEIRAPVEWTAPASLHTTAQVLTGGGVLAIAEVSVNVLPSVDAGPNLLVEIGGAVTLSNASADDGGGGIASYAWSDGAAGGTFDDPSILNPTYTPPPVSGLIDLTLTVTDASGGEASDSCRVCVDVPPSIELGGGMTVDEGESILLDDVVVSDPDGWIVSYAWSDGGAGGEFLPTAAELHPTYTVPDLPGCDDVDILLTLTVTDNWGAETEGSFTLHVRNQNLPPQVDAGEDRSVHSGEEVVLFGAVFDDDVVSVHWEEISGPPADLKGAATTSLRFDAPSVDQPTDLRFRLVAIDLCGQEGSDEVSVTVMPVPEEGSSSPPGFAVELQGFDPGGLPLSPFYSPTIGDRITFTVSLTNLSDEALFNFHVASGGEEVPFPGDTLPPWGRRSASFVVIVGPEDIAGPFEVRVDATARTADGVDVSGNDSIVFFPRVGRAELGLIETTDRSVVGVGETVTYTFRIENNGDVRITDLSLTDDLLGRVDLPSLPLEPGGSIVVSAGYTVREGDLPGPLSDSAKLLGFAAGRPVTADSAATVEILLPIEGGGGSASSSSRVVISEIAWAGTPSDLHDQWIELLSLEEGPVDLTGWRIGFYEKEDPPPDEGGWVTIALSGTIDPLPFSLDARPDGLMKLAAVREESAWRLIDLSWWGAGKSEGDGRGYYLIEWGSDDTVRDIPADLVFTGPPLPGDGGVVLLIDPNGEVVDSANLDNSGRSGWPGGDPRTCATMERIDPLRGDFADNWQTSPGILAYGRDEDGHLLPATTGKPNSPPLDRLIAFAESEIPLQAVGGGETFFIPSGGDRPWIRITVPQGEAAGGGGSILGKGAFSTRRSADGVELEVDPELLSDETYFVWATCKEGEAYLLLLRGEG